MKERISVRLIAVAVVVVLIGILSLTVVGNHFSDPQTYKGTIEILDEKRNNVVALTGSAAAVSTGLAAIPGEATDPIANELADMSSTFMIIVAAILLEKYLLTLSGMLAFKLLIPVACVLLLVFLWTNREAFAKVAAKLILFGLCLVVLVPVSTHVTSIVDETHQISVQQNMEEANAFADEINSNSNDDEKTITKWINKFSGGMKGLLNMAQAQLENFIDAAAVLLITSCAIPLLTLWVLLWLMRTILGIEISVPADKLKRIARSGSRARTKLLKKDKTNLITHSGDKE